MSVVDVTSPIAIQEGRNLLANVITPAARPIGQFAEEEIILPRGKFANTRYRLDRFPAARIWFELLDAREFLYFVATGPTQSGKTLNCFVIPILYCLFELLEDVIVGVPMIDMAQDKWMKDIRPVIRKSRYRDELPKRGEGSKDGKVRSIRFEHGPTLTFMSFYGDDKSKAGETARNIIITETDGGGEAETTSDEANPIEQLIARAGSFDLDMFVIAECTVSTESGQTWQRYSNGTASELRRPCPKCRAYVRPERSDFRGWQEAENEIEAGRVARFHCPTCEEPWEDRERFAANEKTVLVHKGQSIDKRGRISGPVPETRTLGFRWSAIDNPFRSSEFLGSLEWKAARARDLEDAQKGLDQFQWAIPWKDPEEAEDAFDPYEAMKRVGKHRTPEGIVPLDHPVLTVGVDIRATQLHYTILASKTNATSRIIQYGVIKVLSRKHGVERAIVAALRYLRDNVLAYGFPEEETGIQRLVDGVWIDSGWQPKRVYYFVNECEAIDGLEGVFQAAIGRGQGKQYDGTWTPRAKVGRDCPFIGDEFYFSWIRSVDPFIQLAIVNADAWKSFVHSRLSTPIVNDQDEEQPGAMTLHLSSSGDHSEYMRHLGAEHPVRVWIPDRGETVIWRAISRVNHYFDTAYLAAACASYNGVNLEPVQEIPSTPAEEHEDYLDDLRTPDGRHLLD